jgi:hypothetical protein
MWEMGVTIKNEHKDIKEFVASGDFTRNVNINNPEVYRKAPDDLER